MAPRTTTKMVDASSNDGRLLLLLSSSHHRHNNQQQQQQPQSHSQRRSILSMSSSSSSSSASSSFSADSNHNNNNNNENETNNKNIPKKLQQQQQEQQVDPWMEALRAHKMQSIQQRQAVRDNWKTGQCTSQVAGVFPDWVRRLDVDYPWVACGSASETIFVSHLETGQVIVGGTAQPQQLEQELAGQERIYRILYGDHDGGGTLAIAFYNGLIAVAGRQGSVDLWRLQLPKTAGKTTTTTATGATLLYQGRMEACQGVLVTSLQFYVQPAPFDHHHDDEGRDRVYLWVGTADGRVMAFVNPHGHTGNEDDEDDLDDDDHDDDDTFLLPLAARKIPTMQFQFGDKATSPRTTQPSPVVILSMSFTNELQMQDNNNKNNNNGVGVITTSDGDVHLISLKPPATTTITATTTTTPSWSFRLPLDTTSARAPKALPTCACFIRHDDPHHSSSSSSTSSSSTTTTTPGVWSIACGGSNGSLYLQPLNTVTTAVATAATFNYPSLMVLASIDKNCPFDRRSPPSPLLPRHWGPTQCVATPMPGLLLSGGQDGSIRVWDVSCTTTTNTATTTASSSPVPTLQRSFFGIPTTTSTTTTTTTTTSSIQQQQQQPSLLQAPRPLLRRRFLYQFHGYKVWLKSMWCGGGIGGSNHQDGITSSLSSLSTSSMAPFLISDGSDNTILMHKFLQDY